VARGSNLSRYEFQFILIKIDHDTYSPDLDGYCETEEEVQNSERKI